MVLKISSRQTDKFFESRLRPPSLRPTISTGSVEAEHVRVRLTCESVTGPQKWNHPKQKDHSAYNYAHFFYTASPFGGKWGTYYKSAEGYSASVELELHLEAKSIFIVGECERASNSICRSGICVQFQVFGGIRPHQRECILVLNDCCQTCSSSRLLALATE